MLITAVFGLKIVFINKDNNEFPTINTSVVKLSRSLLGVVTAQMNERQHDTSDERHYERRPFWFKMTSV